MEGDEMRDKAPKVNSPYHAPQTRNILTDRLLLHRNQNPPNYT